MEIEERIADVLREHHLWDEKYLAHVVSELVAELGMAKECRSGAR